MNGKIALSGLSILASLALIGGATFAYFSDVGASNNNVFGAGTFDLKLTNNNEPALDNVSATWNGSDMAPGGAIVSATLNLKNSGTVAGHHVHLKATNTISDSGNDENLGPMSRHLKITTLTYDGNDVLSSVTDKNGNGQPDLEDLQTAGDGIIIGSLTDTGSDHPLVMGVQLDSEANNTYQGDSVTSVFTVTLHQVAD